MKIKIIEKLVFILFVDYVFYKFSVTLENINT